jgi:hypothetical protein
MWEYDSPEMYIGLYNAHGWPHRDLKQGAEPDYHFLFDNRGMHNIPLDTIIVRESDEHYYFGRVAENRYRIETKVSFAALAEIRYDSLFIPHHHMRIPIDFSVNDNDAGDVRQGILTYSKYNNDNSWKDVSLWSHTWVYDMTTDVQTENEIRNTYFSLSQNYPNPFNPATRIDFYIPRSGHVSLCIYDVRGRLTRRIIDSKYKRGQHSIRFESFSLASGIYFYQLISGGYTATRKMMVLH